MQAVLRLYILRLGGVNITPMITEASRDPHPRSETVKRRLPWAWGKG